MENERFFESCFVYRFDGNKNDKIFFAFTSFTILKQKEKTASRLDLSECGEQTEANMK